MTREDALALVSQTLTAVAPDVDPTEAKPDEDLREAFDLDSMDLLNFVVGLHERTGLEIPESDYPKLWTLQGCVTYLLERT